MEMNIHKQENKTKQKTMENNKNYPLREKLQKKKILTLPDTATLQ